MLTGGKYETECIKNKLVAKYFVFLLWWSNVSVMTKSIMLKS